MKDWYLKCNLPPHFPISVKMETLLQSGAVKNTGLPPPTLLSWRPVLLGGTVLILLPATCF